MGHDARHTLELPDGNRTTDAEICRIARLEDRIVVTKDGDFARSHEISSEPGRLLLVSTGNIDNQALFALLRDNLSAAAHLIHGSSEGRFVVTYAPGGVTDAEIRAVNFGYMPLAEALKQYDPAVMKDGFNTVDGEDVFYISNPAIGLWGLRKNFSE